MALLVSVERPFAVGDTVYVYGLGDRRATLSAMEHIECDLYRFTLTDYIGRYSPLLVIVGQPSNGLGRIEPEESLLEILARAAKGRTDRGTSV